MIESKRDITIDLLRGIAILAMILIHTTVFYVSNPAAFFLWNYSQWAVPVFIFCSGYLFFKNPPVGGFLKKRFLRLLLPYYIFLPFYLLVTELISPKTLTINYILQSIFIIGGVPINWLVLLFLQFAILLPIILWIQSKHKILFWVYSIIASGSSVVFLFWKLPFDWKYIMWLPWSTVLIFSLFMIKGSFLKISFLLSFILYLLSLASIYLMGHSTNFYDNKYPPNLLIISFGIMVISGFYLLTRHCEEPKRRSNPVGIATLLTVARNNVKKLIIFLSRYSYSIYFIHYLILTLLTPWFDKLKHVWFLLFFLVIIPTIFIQKLFNLIMRQSRRQ